MEEHHDTIIEVKPDEENAVPHICMVHDGLRRVKPEAYKPVVVSIGPYHKDDDKLKPMQQNKKRYLKLLLERRNAFPKERNQSEESEDTYLLKLAEIKSEARKCYAKSPITDSASGEDFLESDKFLKMMLLDGCFILEFLRKYDGEVIVFDKHDPIPRVAWMINQILSDLMLFENQLPYFVLSTLYEMTKCGGEKPLEEMAMSCFNYLLPRPRLYFDISVGEYERGEINHLLHLVHVLCCPLPENTNKTSTGGGNSVQTTCLSFLVEKIITRNRITGESSDDQTRCPLLPPNCDSGNIEKGHEMKNKIGTVVELQEAGVNFKKVGKVYDGILVQGTEKNYVSLFDMEFKCGEMKVPCFKVDASTEAFLRNLIAYEQHYFPDNKPKYFTDFATLMNQLINSEEDTKVLRSKEIIMNFLGDDEKLSELFNSLIIEVCESETERTYFCEVRQKVEMHCKKICNTWAANLNRKYFNNPWAGISTFAAIILLLLTVVQTVVALITWLT